MDPVWQPRADAPVEPLETLIRAARQLIPMTQTEPDKSSFTKTLTLDLADWGNPAEVTMRCAVGRRSTFAGRGALEYVFDGSLASARHYRSFRGQAFLDVETGAVLDIEFATTQR